jgi:TonB C terminal
MAAMRLAWRTGYEGDEIAVGIALAVALHVLPLAAILVKAAYPSHDEPEQALIGKPIVAASLLKLGKPMDPSKLPDRLVPRQRTAPKKDVVASKDDPLEKKPDAGPPPPLAEESDITRLVNKTDPFAEDAGKDRPEEGHAAGLEGGTETDPNKVRAGDMYGAVLRKFFQDHWQYPTVISQGEANRLCVVYQFRIDQRMVIWNVRMDPMKKSGNDLFDDSARTMLQKLMEENKPLPPPPPEVADQYRGHTVAVGLSGSNACDK